MLTEPVLTPPTNWSVLHSPILGGSQSSDGYSSDPQFEFLIFFPALPRVVSRGRRDADPER